MFGRHRDIVDHCPPRTRDFELLESQTQNHDWATDGPKSTTNERTHSWDTGIPKKLISYFILKQYRG